MIEFTDVNGKVWWVNPSAVSAVAACEEFGYEIGFQKIKTKTYIYIGALKHVIQMAEEPEEVLRKLQGNEPWSHDADTVTIPPAGRMHQ